MMTIRKAAERGQASHGWLESRHTFSFGDYFDAKFMGFGPLRVINEDRVLPSKGFPAHGHQDMEIISWVLSGALQHQDSLGNGAVIRPGEAQRMTAGTGIRHSEYNASSEERVHFLQIWIEPEHRGLTPGYEQIPFADEDLRGGFRLIGSRDGREGSVTVHQDVDLYAIRLEPDGAAEFWPRDDRLVWLQLAHGRATLNGEALEAGDGVALVGEAALRLESETNIEALLFDMAGRED